MTVSSTSEWNYPESLALEDSDEVSELSRFIYDKVIFVCVPYLELLIIDRRCCYIVMHESVIKCAECLS